MELYNSIKGTNYDEHTELVINTLQETLFTHQKNDVSFLIDGKLVVLAEQQSTINWNMPYRFLLPVARLLENAISDKDAVYRQKLVKLPRPEFIVLYNGTADFPNKKEMRLSDAFEEVEGVGTNLELLVTVYNINSGHNEDLVKKSGTLYGYAAFVEQVRANNERVRKEYPQMNRKEALKEAIARTVASCKAQGILTEFLEQLTKEEVYMLATEWNLDRALEIRWEEGMEDGVEIGVEKGIGIGVEKGIEIGREEGLGKVAIKALQKGYSMELVQELTGLSVECIKSLPH